MFIIIIQSLSTGFNTEYKHIMYCKVSRRKRNEQNKPTTMLYIFLFHYIKCLFVSCVYIKCNRSSIIPCKIFTPAQSSEHLQRWPDKTVLVRGTEGCCASLKELQTCDAVTGSKELYDNGTGGRFKLKYKISCYYFIQHNALHARTASNNIIVNYIPTCQVAPLYAPRQNSLPDSERGQFKRTWTWLRPAPKLFYIIIRILELYLQCIMVDIQCEYIYQYGFDCRIDFIKGKTHYDVYLNVYTRQCP